MEEGDGDVGEDGGGVGVDHGDDDDGQGSVPAPPEARGREPPPSSSLTFSLGGRRVSPLVLDLHGVGGVRAPPRLDLSLSISVFSDYSLSPSLIFPEIRNSDWAEILTRSLSRY